MFDIKSFNRVVKLAKIGQYIKKNVHVNKRFKMHELTNLSILSLDVSNVKKKPENILVNVLSDMT